MTTFSTPAIPTRRLLRSITAGVLLLTWLSTGYGGEWEAQIPEVVKGSIVIEIRNQQFTNPATGVVGENFLVIPIGMKVTWINRDPLVTVNGDQGLMPHGIQVSDEGDEVLTASPIMTEQQSTFSYSFNETGVYSYNCFIHPSMQGKIVVVSMG
jgi:plastocyanin